MCDPVTIGLTAASSFLQIQSENAKADAQENQFWQNRTSAIQARDLKVSQNNLRTMQEQEQLSEEEFQGRLQALRTREKQFVSGLEGGLSASSGSLMSILRETEATQLRNETAIGSQQKGLIAQNTMDTKGFEAETENRVNSVARGTPADTLGIIASNAIMATGSYYSAQGDLGMFSPST